MKIPMLDLCRQQTAIQMELDAVIRRVVDQGRYISGEDITLFERQLATRCSHSYAVGVASGTAALHLALLAEGVGPGDEVITAPNSFFATTEAILQTGARPLFADVDAATHLLTPQSVLQVLTDRTRAIVPVHLFGGVVDVQLIHQALRNADRADVLIVEDCAHAAGASRSARSVPIGHTGAFSFNPGKNIGALGDAGAVVTNIEEVAQKVRLLRDHGRSTKNSHLLVGFNARLDRLNDEVLAMKLKYLDQWNAQRRDHAARYDSIFTQCPSIVPVELDPGVISARHQYVVICPARDRLRRHLSERGVATGVHYPSLITDLEPIRKLGFRSEQTPVAAKLNSQLLSLPCFPELERDELDYVIEHTLSFFEEKALCP